MEIKDIWEDDYIIHSYDCDFQKKARITSMCNYFQDSAWKHAENLGWGFQKLMDENKMWILARVSLRINKYPVWSQAIKLQTWPKGTEGLIALRDFQISSLHGEVLVSGTSAWIIADIITRRPQRLDNFSIPFKTDKQAIEELPEKIAESAIAEEKLSFKVIASDLDMYVHVNNVKFIEWVIDAIPFETWGQKSISAFDINYLSEAREGDAIAIKLEEKQDKMLVSVFSTVNGNLTKETCRAKILFRDTAAMFEKIN